MSTVVQNEGRHETEVAELRKTFLGWLELHRPMHDPDAIAQALTEAHTVFAKSNRGRKRTEQVDEATPDQVAATDVDRVADHDQADDDDESLPEGVPSDCHWAARTLDTAYTIDRVALALAKWSMVDYFLIRKYDGLVHLLQGKLAEHLAEHEAALLTGLLDEHREMGDALSEANVGLGRLLEEKAGS